MYSQDEGTGRWQWRPQWGGHSNYQYRWRENVDAFHDGNTAYSLDVPIPSLRGPINSRANQTASMECVREGEYVIFATSGINDDDGIAPAWVMAVSLEEGREGTKLWETTFTPPQAEVQGGGFTQGMNLAAIVPEDEVVVYENTRVAKLWVFDMKTGEKLWESEAGPQLWYYGMDQTFYDGMILAHATYGGEVIAYDSRTGEVQWHYKRSPEYANSPYGRPLFDNPIVSDGKMYAGTSEHSASTPLWRSDGLVCLDLETGEEVWKILWWGADFAVADGILIGFNWFDGQVYAFGKGPSATTVTASPEVSMHGTKVMVKGTVTDQTPTYARNIQNEEAFSLKGTPAISDEDMGSWMEYKFMEQGYPEDAKGVNVTLTVVDPNGNIYDIGSVTSDITGAYGLEFEPLVPGMYQIIASFDGSESYYGSTAVTYITVEEAPAATAEPTPTPAPMTDTYVLGIGAGAIIAIIAIGLVIILMLKKR
jgi:outer membrane protein assembly factor BamB